MFRPVFRPSSDCALFRITEKLYTVLNVKWEEMWGWLADWLTGWLADWLADWLAGWLTVWLAGLLAGWLAG
jgi:hypothetical protein